MSLVTLTDEEEARGAARNLLVLGGSGKSTAASAASSSRRSGEARKRYSRKNNTTVPPTVSAAATTAATVMNSANTNPNPNCEQPVTLVLDPSSSSDINVNDFAFMTSEVSDNSNAFVVNNSSDPEPTLNSAILSAANVKGQKRPPNLSRVAVGRGSSNSAGGSTSDLDSKYIVQLVPQLDGNLTDSDEEPESSASAETKSEQSLPPPLAQPKPHSSGAPSEPSATASTSGDLQKPLEQPLLLDLSTKSKASDSGVNLTDQPIDYSKKAKSSLGSDSNSPRSVGSSSLLHSPPLVSPTSTTTGVSATTADSSPPISRAPLPPKKKAISMSVESLLAPSPPRSQKPPQVFGPSSQMIGSPVKGSASAPVTQIIGPMYHPASDSVPLPTQLSSKVTASSSAASAPSSTLPKAPSELSPTDETTPRRLPSPSLPSTPSTTTVTTVTPSASTATTTTPTTTATATVVSSVNVSATPESPAPVVTEQTKEEKATPEKQTTHPVIEEKNVDAATAKSSFSSVKDSKPGSPDESLPKTVETTLKAKEEEKLLSIPSASASQIEPETVDASTRSDDDDKAKAVMKSNLPVEKSLEVSKETLHTDEDSSVKRESEKAEQPLDSKEKESISIDVKKSEEAVDIPGNLEDQASSVKEAITTSSEAKTSQQSQPGQETTVSSDLPICAGEKAQKSPEESRGQDVATESSSTETSPESPVQVEPVQPTEPVSEKDELAKTTKADGEGDTSEKPEKTSSDLPSIEIKAQESLDEPSSQTEKSPSDSSKTTVSAEDCQKPVDSSKKVASTEPAAVVETSVPSKVNLDETPETGKQESSVEEKDEKEETSALLQEKFDVPLEAKNDSVAQETQREYADVSTESKDAAHSDDTVQETITKSLDESRPVEQQSSETEQGSTASSSKDTIHPESNDEQTCGDGSEKEKLKFSDKDDKDDKEAEKQIVPMVEEQESQETSKKFEVLSAEEKSEESVAKESVSMTEESNKNTALPEQPDQSTKLSQPTSVAIEKPTLVPDQAETVLKEESEIGGKNQYSTHEDEDAISSISVSAALPTPDKRAESPSSKETSTETESVSTRAAEEATPTMEVADKSDCDKSNLESCPQTMDVSENRDEQKASTVPIDEPDEKDSTVPIDEPDEKDLSSDAVDDDSKTTEQTSNSDPCSIEETRPEKTDDKLADAKVIPDEATTSKPEVKSDSVSYERSSPTLPAPAVPLVKATGPVEAAAPPVIVAVKTVPVISDEPIQENDGKSKDDVAVAELPTEVESATTPSPPPAQNLKETSGGIEPAVSTSSLDQHSETADSQSSLEAGIGVEVDLEDDIIAVPIRPKKELVCNVCGKECPSLAELLIHKKKHKVDAPFVCQYCQRQYIDKHKYEVHIRYHTGETPFKCHLCEKGFRDDRKMRLHVARHTSSLNYKCHLCPRSFEGQKGLDKHLLAHKMGRYVEPKVVTNSDGSTTMAIPATPGDASAGDDPNVANLISGVTVQQQAVEDPQAGTISLSMDDLMQYAQPADNVIADDSGLEAKLAEGASKFVPLNMDEFMQSSEKQTANQSSSTADNVSAHNDSGEFPDLLDSESNLESLSSSIHQPSKVNGPSGSSTVHEDTESGLTFATMSGLKPDAPRDEKGNVVVARKSTAAPIVKASTQPEVVNNHQDSAVPVQTEDLVTALANEAISQLAKAQIKLPAGTCLVPADAKCEPTQLQPGNHNQSQLESIAAATGTTAEALTHALNNAQGPGATPMTITIQYKIYPEAEDGQPQTVAVKRDLADLINETPEASAAAAVNAAGLTIPAEALAMAAANATVISTDSPVGSMPSTPTPPVVKAADPASTPIVAPATVPAAADQPNVPNPAKETKKVLSASGKEFEIPKIVTSGFDLDKLLCTICNRTFKNDKTLMGHMLNHFGVAPKMANCPICGLTLQKKSYARHLRLHGDVTPEECKYCNKTFREKRSLEKHIKAIHQADRPYTCQYCTETFRNQVEQKNHINRHLKDYPHECDVCHMTFQKQEGLTTHYRLHTGEKPYTCEICDKTFTSEKNKKIHVLRHQGGLPHKCEVCGMTFQSRSHLIKHATGHARKGATAQGVAAAAAAAAAASVASSGTTGASSSNTSASINNFLESFGASLENDMMLGMDEDFGEGEKAGGDLDAVRLSVDTIPDSLEDAAAQAAFTFGQQDLSDALLNAAAADAGGGVQADGGEVAGTSAETGLLLQCDICMAKLKDKRAYIVHMKRHAGVLNFRCKFCNLVFQGQTNLNQHIKSLHNVDPATVTPIIVDEEEEGEDSSQSSEASVQKLTQPGTITVGGSSSAPASGGIKCALCPETFSTPEALQKHTNTHFAESSADAILREKLLKLNNKKRKKKKRKGKPGSVEGGEVAATPTPGKQKSKKSYSCLLCNMTFSKKASWRIHKIRHAGKGWKCQFCNDLHENSVELKKHLEGVHKMEQEEMMMLGILKTANMFVVTKRVKSDVKDDSAGGSNPSSESSSEDSEEGDDEEDDLEDDDGEEDMDEEVATTPSSTPTPVASVAGDVAIVSAVPRSLQLASPTPSNSSNTSGTPLPTALPYITDQSLFDLDALTCHACNKSFKNTRAFKLHRDRHQGTLNHKCPDCPKTFNGRSEVNRHMTAIHGRALRPGENTKQQLQQQPQQQPAEQQQPPVMPPTVAPALVPAATVGQQPTVSTIASQELQLTSAQISLPKPIVEKAKDAENLPQQSNAPVAKTVDNIALTPVAVTAPAKVPEIQQLSEKREDDVSVVQKVSEEPGAAAVQPSELTTSAASCLDMPFLIDPVPAPSSSKNKTTAANETAKEEADDLFDKILENVKEVKPLVPEKGMQDEDDDEQEPMPPASPLSPAPSQETVPSPIPEVPKDPIVTDMIIDAAVSSILDVDNDDITRPVSKAPAPQVEPSQAPTTSGSTALSDETSKTAEDGETAAKGVNVPDEASSPNQRSSRRSERVDQKEKEKDDEDKNIAENMPLRTRRSRANFSAKSPDNTKGIASKSGDQQGAEGDSGKKRRGRPKRQAADPEDESDTNEKSDTTTTTDKDDDSATTAGETSGDETTERLLKQKGVVVNRQGKLMVPSHRINLPDELCQIVENKKGKKMYRCPICKKEFSRKDMINYHAYQEHREEVLEYSKGLPEILTRENEEAEDKAKKTVTNAIFKRIFKPKKVSISDEERERLRTSDPPRPKVDKKPAKAPDVVKQESQPDPVQEAEKESAEPVASQELNDKAEKAEVQVKNEAAPDAEANKDSQPLKRRPGRPRKQSEPDKEKLDGGDEKADSPERPTRSMRQRNKSETQPPMSPKSPENAQTKPRPRGRPPAKERDRDPQETGPDASPAANEETKKRPSLRKRHPTTEGESSSITTCGENEAEVAEDRRSSRNHHPSSDEKKENTVMEAEPGLKSLRRRRHSSKEDDKDKQVLVEESSVSSSRSSRLRQKSEISSATPIAQGGSPTRTLTKSPSRNVLADKPVPKVILEDIALKDKSGLVISPRQRNASSPQKAETGIAEAKSKTERVSIADGQDSSGASETAVRRRPRKQKEPVPKRTKVDGGEGKDHAAPPNEAEVEDPVKSPPKTGAVSDNAKKSHDVTEKSPEKHDTPSVERERRSLRDQEKEDVVDASAKSASDPEARASRRGAKKPEEIPQLADQKKMPESNATPAGGKKVDKQPPASAQNRASPLGGLVDLGLPRNDEHKKSGPPPPSKQEQQQPKQVEAKATKEKSADVQVDDVDDHDESLPVVRKYRKVNTFLKDIQDLLELQEQVRRLRSRRLTDSDDAMEIMKKYRPKKRKLFSLHQDSTKLILRRVRKAPTYRLSGANNGEFKLQLTAISSGEKTKEEPRSEAKQAKQPRQEQQQAKSSTQVVEAASVVKDKVPEATPRKRGRPRKEPVESDQDIKKDSKDPIPAEEATSSPPKKRGRPKRVVSEVSEEPLVAAPVTDTNKTQAKTCAAITEDKKLPEAEAKPSSSPSKKNEVMAQPEVEKPVAEANVVKKRGRPKRPAVVSGLLSTSSSGGGAASKSVAPEVVAKEVPQAAEVDENMPISKKRRLLKAAVSSPPKQLNESEKDKVEKKSQELKVKPISSPGKEASVTVTAERKRRQSSGGEEKKSQKSPGLKLVIKSPNPNVVPSREISKEPNENVVIKGSEEAEKSDYIVQHVGANPLKIKLKTKISKEDAVDGQVLKKKHKKKKHQKDKEKRPHLVLKIKSPNPYGGPVATLNAPSVIPTGSNGLVSSPKKSQSPHERQERKSKATEPGASNKLVLFDEKSVEKPTPPSASLKPAEVARAPSATSDNSGPNVTFSPESSPEHESESVVGATTKTSANLFTLTGSDSAARGSDPIGLGEGQFHDLMKAIGDDSDEEAASNKVSSVVNKDKNDAKWLQASQSVKQSQVDGSIDTWSRSSSISHDEPPFIINSAGEEAESSGGSDVEAKIPQGVIQKRMKQIQGRPKTKGCLIKHVFSTAAKKRKIVVVKYRKPSRRIFDKDEYFERVEDGTLDDDYNEDTDDPTMKQRPRPSKSSESNPPTPLSVNLDDEEEAKWRADKKYVNSLESLECALCGRSFANVIRMHAHLQMHFETNRKQKQQTKSSAEAGDIPQVDGEFDLSDVEDMDEDEGGGIDQVDGETDLVLDTATTNAAATSAPRTTGTLTSSQRSSGLIRATTTTGSNGNPTQLLILRRGSGSQMATGSASATAVSGTKVYQCGQCPEVFPGQKALLTHQSLMHNGIEGAAASSGGLFPCQNCSLAFRDADSLDTHMRSEHGKQQIVTIIQADLHGRGVVGGSDSFGSAGSSLAGSSSSSTCSSGTSSSIANQFGSGGSGGAGNVFDIPGVNSSDSSPFLMKQDPCLMFNNERDEEEEQDLTVLDESLQLFETSSLIDSGDSAIHLSLDDLASFAQPIGGGTNDGSHASFDTSIETSSFLTDTTDTLDLMSESATTPLSVSTTDAARNGGESRTPSLPDDGEFPCSQCEKRFGNRRNLLSHMRRHTGDFKLFCDDCGKGFFTQSKLESHKRKHTGEKPFRCLLKTCLKRFRYKGDLSKHIKKYHPGHTQPLTPVPLQEDEIVTLQNNQQVAAGQMSSESSNRSNPQTVTIVNATAATASASSTSTSSTGNKYFLPLLPRHPVQQEELVASGFSKELPTTAVSTESGEPTTPLDENLLDFLNEDDPPLLSLSPGPSLAATSFPPPPSLPPPPPPPPPAVTASSSKLHEVLTQGRPKARVTEAFVVPTSTAVRNKQTHIVHMAPQHQKSTSGSGSSNKAGGSSGEPLAISISQVFACAQPLPLQEDARHQSKGKMTTMADLDHANSGTVLSLGHNAAFVQGLVTAKKNSTTTIGGRVIGTAGVKASPSGFTAGHVPTQHVKIVRTIPVTLATSASGVPGSSLATASTGAATVVMAKPGKPFVCEFKGCNKSFEKSTFLRRHAKLHSSDCKFVCDVCSKCFESQSKLDDHYRKHTGAKPFQCHICGNAFRYKGDRTKHLKNLHGVHKAAPATASAKAASASETSSVLRDSMSAFLASTAEDTSSSISSFQSTSDTTSHAGSLLESPTKTEAPNESFNSIISEASLGADLPEDSAASSDAVTMMCLDDVIPFAQPIADMY